MTFLNPAGLWLFAALLPIAALYLLKVRPERRPTSALFLWDKVFHEKRASALFNRMREILSMLLVLLAAALISLAVARPVIGSVGDKRDLLIVIDNSLSMNAPDGNLGSRFESARKAAANIINTLDGERQASVALLSDSLRVISGMTSSAKASVSAIDKAAPTMLASDLTELVELGKSDSALSSKNRMIFITDGAFADAEKFRACELLKVGTPLENVGICGFDVARVPGTRGRIEVFFQLVSSMKSETDVELTLYYGSMANPRKVMPINLAPGISKGEVFTLDSAPEGRWLLTLDTKDKFMDDNTAYAFLPEPDPVRVMVAPGASDVFFMRCLDAFEAVGGDMKYDRNSPEVIVGNGAFTIPEGIRNAVIFNPYGESPFWKMVGEKKSIVPALVSVKDHRAVKYASLDGYMFHGVRKLTAPANSLILAADPDGTPLIYRTSAGGKNVCVINMDPLATEFFMSVSFPVLMSSIALDLAQKNTDRTSSFSPGHTFSFDSGFSIQHDGGQPEKIAAGGVAAMEKTGFWTVMKSGDSKGRVYACSLKSPYESLLDNSSLKDTAASVPRGRPLSDIFLIAAAILLAAESILYHKRKAG